MELLTDPQILEALRGLLSTFILGLVSLLAAAMVAGLALGRKKLNAWVSSKVASAESDAHYDAFECATGKLETLTKNAVLEVEQTLVRQLKADKKWDAETAVEARDAAVAVALNHLGSQGMGELEKCLGHGPDIINGMLRTYVEKHVSSYRPIKRTAGAPVSPLGVSQR